MDISKAVILEGKRKSIMEKIKENREKELFFLKVKASVPLLVYLLNKSGIKKLIVLPSVYRILGKKVADALEKSGVEIKVFGNKIGRPGLNERKIKEIIRKKGKDKVKIEELGISRRAYYYYKKKFKKNK